MAPKARADCQPIYGGGTSCQPASILVVKNIFNPQTNAYVHDLGINDVQFRPGDVLTFQITVTNTGTTTTGPIQLIDSFPMILTFFQGGGTFNPSADTLTMSLPALAPGQSQVVTLAGRILPDTSFPSTQDSNCFTNLATATLPDGTNSQDTSQFCVFHPLTASPAPTNTIPPSTGPNGWVILSLLPTAAIGAVVAYQARKEQHYAD